MNNLRLAYPVKQEKYIHDSWGGSYKLCTTDEWDRNGYYMFCNCCGAQAYKASELAQVGAEFGIGVCRGRLNVKSTDIRQIDHVKTKNGWLTCWIELPREVEPDESEEW